MNRLQRTSRRITFVAFLALMAGIALVGAPRPAMAHTVPPAHHMTVAHFGPPFGGGFGMRGFGMPFGGGFGMRGFGMPFRGGFFDRDDRRFFFDRDDRFFNRRFFFDRDDRFFHGPPFFGPHW